MFRCELRLRRSILSFDWATCSDLDGALSTSRQSLLTYFVDSMFLDVLYVTLSNKNVLFSVEFDV